MAEVIRIGVIGDYDPAFRPHEATDEAIAHAADHLSIRAEVCWLPTESLLDVGAQAVLERMDGLWAAPGSPYRSMEGALAAIRFARERDRPFIGT